MTKQEMTKINEEKGFYFFSKNTLRFFKSRISEKLYRLRNKEYLFVSSEKPPYGNREYKVRHFNEETGKVETFVDKTFKTSSQAHSFIKSYLNKSL